MLHDGEGIVEVVQQGAPIPVLLGLSESNRMVFEPLPFDEQQICARRLDRTRQRQTPEASHRSDDGLRLAKRQLEVAFLAGDDWQ